MPFAIVVGAMDDASFRTAPQMVVRLAGSLFPGNRAGALKTELLADALNAETVDEVLDAALAHATAYASCTNTIDASLNSQRLRPSIPTVRRALDAKDAASALADVILSAAALSYSSSLTLRASDVDWDVAKALVARNAALLANPSWWKLATAAQVELVSVTPRKTPATSSIVGSMLDARANRIAEAAYARWGDAVTVAVMAWARSHDAKTIGEGWRSQIARHSEAAWRLVAKNPAGPIVELLTESIARYGSIEDVRPGALADIFQRTVGSNSDQPLAALVLAMSSAPISQDHSPVLYAHSYDGLCEAAEREAIDEWLWDRLDATLPKLGHVPGWDRCERMRRVMI